MKVEIRANGSFDLFPETETLEDIGVAIIKSSYESAQVFGLGGMRPFVTKMTREMALRMLNGEDVSHDYILNHNKKHCVHMDYVFGRCCKTYIRVLTDRVAVCISTRDRNPGAIMERAVELLKETK